MGSAQPRQTAAMASWLDDVQRDPRTLGAFRRRIEALLTDPAVARRIARRLDGRGAAPSGHAARMDDSDRRPANGLRCGGGVSRGIFGLCDCPGTCCLMLGQAQGSVPSLAALPMLGVATGFPRH